MAPVVVSTPDGASSDKTGADWSFVQRISVAAPPRGAPWRLYPITPSTQMGEGWADAVAKGKTNVHGRRLIFFEPEGEHSAQSGAMGAALTGGRFISNASSSQGVLYALESHYVTVGKKVGGFVLQIAARSVSKHSLNVMAGHDDVYALLSSGYTILFGSNPQEAADLAAIAYRVSSLSMVPVANAMDGFATSHMQCETLLPEPELLKEFLGDPSGRIKSPTVAQEMLYGAKGRVYQLQQYLHRHGGDIQADSLDALGKFLENRTDEIEADNEGDMVKDTLAWIPEELTGQWRRQWINAYEKGTRQRVPAMVDVNNPGLTGGVQNQADFQAGLVDHKTHFVNEIPRFIRQAMDEYGELTGRQYNPVQTFMAEDAEYVIVGLGSVTDDAEAVTRNLDNHINGNTETYTSEYRMKKGSDAWIWVLDRGKVIEWNQNKKSSKLGFDSLICFIPAITSWQGSRASVKGD